MTELRDGELESAREMAEALAAREITAVELTERAIRRAEAWQPWTNAFSQLWANLAVERAQSLPEGVGIPTSVKDLFDVAGTPATGCCRAYQGRVSERNAPVIERTLAAGCVFVGKTNQHELAAGGTNLVSACGRTGNPWDPERMTGGSSGGAAAAVAAGVVPWSLGSDTGGSIRIPSSMCGTFGLKPTSGQLPIDGLLPLAPSMDCPGPLAATVGDLRALYRVMKGHADIWGPVPEGPPGSIRVGLPGGFFAELVHPEVTAAVRGVARTLEQAGADWHDVPDDPPIAGGDPGGARATWNTICYAEFAGAHRSLLDRLDLVSPQPRSWLERGAATTKEELAAANRRRGEVRSWFLDRLAGLDALLIPTTPYPAPRADQDRVDLGPAGVVEVDRVGPGWLTSSVNLANLPAVTLPAARSGENMPIGVSLVGRDDAEEELLAIAELWERASGYTPSRPSLPTVAL